MLGHARLDLILRFTAPAATHRQLPGIQLMVIVTQVVGVLHVQVLDLRDGRQTEAHVITATVTGKTLAIAMQASVLLGHRQVIVGPDELAQADVVIAGANQLFTADLPHGVLVGRAAKRAGHPGVFRAITIRRAGIVENVQPVRFQFDQRRQFQGETARRLPSVAVAQVNVDGAKTKRARRIDQRMDRCRVLIAID
ncbi:hypothetical protein D3C84_857240 [compost metagenome]